MITPRPPKIEEELKEDVKADTERTQKKREDKKRVVRVEVKARGVDDR